jgi:hypothetical protein
VILLLAVIVVLPLGLFAAYLHSRRLGWDPHEWEQPPRFPMRGHRYETFADHPTPMHPFPNNQDKD